MGRTKKIKKVNGHQATTKMDAELLEEIRVFTKVNGLKLGWFITQAVAEKLESSKNKLKEV